jgi:hypothetical protein
MTATQVQLTGGGFQDSEGNLLADGYLEFVLSQDSSVTGVGNICAGITITIQLDSDGNAASSASSPAAADQYLWGNDVLNTPNTFYKVTGFTAEGQPAWGPNNQQVYGSSPFDLGTWVPNTVYQWTPPVQQVSLNVNGVAASSQIRQNLESTDASVTITDEGNGNINFQAASGFAAGSNVLMLPSFNGEDGGLSNYTMMVKIPAALIQATGTSVVVSILSGSNLGGTGLEIGSASIGATLASRYIGGVGSPNLAWTTAPVTLTFPTISATSTVYESDAATITIDTEHDYYILIYLTSGNTSNIPYLDFSGSSQSSVPTQWQSCFGYMSGNHTADSDATGLQSPSGNGNLHLVCQVTVG